MGREEPPYERPWDEGDGAPPSSRLYDQEKDPVGGPSPSDAFEGERFGARETEGDRENHTERETPGRDSEREKAA